MSAASGSSPHDDAAQREAAAGRLMLPKLEEYRDRLFERIADRYRFGDGGTITLTLTNAEAREILGGDHEGRSCDADGR